jgi:hypothetical protein
MKRKLALLLAAVMAVTAFPMTAMAASDNSLTRQAVRAGDKVLLVEERDGLPASGDKWSRIGYLKIGVKENIRANEIIKVALENAEFAFGKTIEAEMPKDPESKTVDLDKFLDENKHDLENEIPDLKVAKVTGANIKAYREALETEIAANATAKDEIKDVIVNFKVNGTPEKINRENKNPKSFSAEAEYVSTEFTIPDAPQTQPAATVVEFETAFEVTLPVAPTGNAVLGSEIQDYKADLIAAVEEAIEEVGTNAVVTVTVNGTEAAALTASDSYDLDTHAPVVAIVYDKFTTQDVPREDYEDDNDVEFKAVAPKAADGYKVSALKTWKTALLAELKKVNSDVTGVEVKYNATDTLTDASDNEEVVQIIDSIKVSLSSAGTGKKPITAYNNDPAVGSYDEGNKVYTRVGSSLIDSKYADTPYTLEVAGNDTVAALRLTNGAPSGSTILIPIVVELVGDKDEYRIRISDAGNTTISETSHIFASKADGKTKTYVKDTVTARSEFELKRITIEEQKLGSIKDGSFYLKAPKGYEFKHTNVTVGIEPGLSGSVESSVTYDNRRDKTDHSVLLVSVNGIKSSTDVRGALYLEDVVLIAEDEETIKAGDVNLKIENYGSSTIYTEESFKVATASDYTIELKRVKDTIPTLVSGRYEGSVKYDNKNKNFSGMTDNLDDEYHKAATVKVSEKIPAAWWSERTTKLTLPEDVTILKAEFDEIKNLVDASKNDLRTGTNGTTAYFYNTQKKVNRVIVDDNELTITNIKIANDDKNNLKKASFELDLWLGMAANFEGDIDLTLSGSAVEKSTNADYPKVTIAKAIKPVEVKVDKVSEVQVGYQYFTVSDFSITETAAGNLLKGREVRVSITDGISIDMEIAKGFTAKVTEGDLKISNVTTSSVLSTRPNANTKTEGQITFEIDRESDEASTISFSNVQVKVSRNVPYSNLSASEDRGIDLVVWGDAIAANYYQLAENDEDKFVNQNDLFTVPGVSAKYINVVTVANDASSEFKNTVKVTIGNPVIKINDQDFTMPVAAYVSTASNSTMVPVRFVANALGLADETVKWDDANKTVTVDAGTRIVQFQIGNTNYLVNGVSVPMVSPDGLPVAAEITSERAFIPFRALGEAFNVTVGWDAATSTATYNAAEAK